MPPVIYQVRLVIKPELEAEFNAWYEGEYIPKLMRETPHFTAVRRYEGEFNGAEALRHRLRLHDRNPGARYRRDAGAGRADDNAAFYRWKDRAITLHESVSSPSVWRFPMLEDWVEERVKRLEDRFAIQDLVASYCSAIDGRDLARFVSLFTDDAVMRHRDGVMRLDGRQAIEAYYTTRFAGYGFTFHYPHAVTVTFDS